MKILLLSPLPLSGSNNGVKLRGRSLLSALEKVGAVEVLAFQHLEGGDGDCPLPPFPGAWERLLSPVPSLVRCFTSPEFRRLVAERAAGCQLCVCLGLQMFQYARFIPDGVPVLLDNYNVECDILWGLARRRNGLKKLYWMWQALKLQRFERQALRLGTRVLAISHSDSARFRQIAPDSRVEVVAPGLDLSRLQSIEGAPVPDRLAFVGALDWHVNIDCARWFAREVFPLVQKRRPGATFTIVGRNPPPEVRELDALPGVSVHGDVPEIAPFLEQAAAVVVPLRFGSGVQFKVIEGLASGRPVVTSPVGFEGLDLTREQDLLVCEGIADFAQGCVRVLEDRGLAEGLGRQGRAASRRFLLERMEQDIARICAQLPGR